MKAGANESLISRLLPIEEKPKAQIDQGPSETAQEVLEGVADFLESMESHIQIVKPHHTELLKSSKVWAKRCRSAIEG